MNVNSYSQEHITNLLEAGYCLGFTGITRPSDNQIGGSCIGNIFCKTDNLKPKTFELTDSLTDHLKHFRKYWKN